MGVLRQKSFVSRHMKRASSVEMVLLMAFVVDAVAANSEADARWVSFLWGSVFCGRSAFCGRWQAHMRRWVALQPFGRSSTMCW
jgi:hypothetical protein